MNDIRRFETALDRELDVLSARIAKALERVRGKKVGKGKGGNPIAGALRPFSVVFLRL